MKKVTTQGLVGVLKRNGIPITTQKMSTTSYPMPRFKGVSVTQDGNLWKVYSFPALPTEHLFDAHTAMKREGYAIFEVRFSDGYFYVTRYTVEP